MVFAVSFFSNKHLAKPEYILFLKEKVKFLGRCGVLNSSILAFPSTCCVFKIWNQQVNAKGNEWRLTAAQDAPLYGLLLTMTLVTWLGIWKRRSLHKYSVCVHKQAGKLWIVFWECEVKQLDEYMLTTTNEFVQPMRRRWNTLWKSGNSVDNPLRRPGEYVRLFVRQTKSQSEIKVKSPYNRPRRPREGVEV
jgi:hypothetical protein